MEELTQQERYLFQLLMIKRQELAQRGGTKVGLPDDNALASMAQLKPVKLEDLESIPGVGTAITRNHGEELLSVVRKFFAGKQAATTVSVGRDVRAVLTALERQLVGINRRNRLLYLSSLRDRTAVDLTVCAARDALYAMLFHGKKVVVPYGIVLSDDADSATTEGQVSAQTNLLKDVAAEHTKLVQAPKKRVRRKKGENEAYAKLSVLLREVTRTFRETGSYDLYVGYPFAEGKLNSDDNFPIRAPLALFPITAERTPKEITLKPDTAKSVLYNTNFMLAVAKMDGKLLDLESESIDEISRNFEKDLVKAYAAHGIKIGEDVDSGALLEMQDVTADRYKLVPPSTYVLRNHMVIGRFALADSALQRDFAKILEWEEIPKNVVELVESVKDTDLKEKMDQVELENVNRLRRYSEHEIHYINLLNASQEQVIAALHTHNKLVVAGPPGTGKSQVITSVIADFIRSDKNVLMVSEKKAALDVIRSRLGILSDFVLQVDDAEDKNGFYDQITRMLSVGEKTQAEQSASDASADRIEGNLRRLERIASTLYDTGGLGVELYKLYRSSCKYDFSNRSDYLAYDAVRGLAVRFPDGYPLSQRAFQKLQANDVAFQEWGKTLFDCPVSYRVRVDYMPIEISDLRAVCEYADDAIRAAATAGFFERIKIVSALKKRLKAELPKFFSTLTGERKLRVNRKLIRAFDTQLPSLIKIVNNYRSFVQARSMLASFDAAETAMAERTYRLTQLWNCTFRQAAYELYRFYVVTRIEAWETEHRDVLGLVDNYDAILSEIRTDAVGRQESTRNEVYELLGANFARMMNASKKFGDMRRVAENNRKTNVVKYIQRFDNELFLGVRVWLLTPEIASAILPLRPGMFDLVVFDEASQLYVERAIPALVRGAKILIAGDSKQLRPSSLGMGRIGMDEETLENEGVENTALEVDSLLDLAETKYDRVMLDGHYRSKYEELIAFSNYAFYRGNLLVSPNTAAVSKPIEVIKTDGIWENRCNEREAERVVKLIQDIFKTRAHHETIGVITFNVIQRDCIEKLLDAECVKDAAFNQAFSLEQMRTDRGEDIGLFVKNIENVQGDERDIIIFSVGYAPNAKGKVTRQFGWLNCMHGENRLNVAITRAKQKIYLVTSITPDQFDVDDLDSVGPKLLKKYMEYAFSVDAGDTERTKLLLESLGAKSARAERARKDKLVDEVCQSLTARGIACDRNIGIGGYVIDLAIRNAEGAYVLGIEADATVYDSAAEETARARDYHRQNYLESRGWRMTRLWSSRYWHDPEGEINRIVAMSGASAHRADAHGA